MSGKLFSNLFLASCLVTATWLLICAYHFHNILTWILFFVALIVFGGAATVMRVSSQGSDQHGLSKQPSRTRSHTILLIWVCALLLTVLAPVYSYQSGRQILRKWVDALQIEVLQVSIDIQWLDALGDTGRPRYIDGYFQVLSPLDDSKTQIVSVLTGRKGWSIAQKPSDDDNWLMYAICDSSVGGPAISMILYKNGDMTLRSDRVAPDYCFFP
jgi:TRAP-type C4-dicarboxylate transport system permease small subunit